LAVYRIVIGVLTVNGSHRFEIDEFLIQAAEHCLREPQLELYRMPISRVPTPVARNVLVEECRKLKADVLFQLDDDMAPDPKFFEAALKFLLNHDGPAVLACPYVTAPPREDVLVFEWASGQSHTAESPWAVTNIVREDAARRTGIEEVANVGTGCIAFKMSCFDKIDPPHFDYTYEDERHLKVIETEDCQFGRRAHFAGIPLYVSWDHWAGHWKQKRASKPVAVTRMDLMGKMQREAAADKKMKAAPVSTNGTPKPRRIDCLSADALNGNGYFDPNSLLPADVEGWCDFANLYSMVVDGAADGATFVEVGTWQGKSAILMARLIRRSGKKIEFYVVDTFKGDSVLQNAQPDRCADLRSLFDANLKRHGIMQGVIGEPDCQLRVMSQSSVEASMPFADASLDFVFIDAAHDFESVRDDIAAWLPKVKPGGVLAGHDFGEEGVMRAVIQAKLPGLAAMLPSCWMWRHKPADVSARNGELVEAGHG